MDKSLFLSFLILAFSTQASAVICKSVDADGVVSYTDLPVQECQNPVRLPDYSRYSPRPIATPASPVTASEAAGFAGYTSLAIVAPEANGTVRSNEGRVSVGINLEPLLQQNHRIRLLLDGQAVPGDFDGPVIDLSGVERGTHSLRAQVTDATGTVLISSPSVLFTLRKRGLFDGQPEVTLPVEPVPPQPGFPSDPSSNPGFGAPSNPPNYSPGTPNYTPSGGGISTTPGQTNPAFAPSFNR